MVDLSLDLDAASMTYKDLLLVNNDLILTNDAPSSPNGTNAVLQDVIQRLSMFLGEWFMDSSQGTPWFQQILVKNPNLPAIDAIFKNIILGTPGVLQLTKLQLSDPNFSKRTMSMSFSIVSTSGIINYNGLLAPVYAAPNQQVVLSP